MIEATNPEINVDELMEKVRQEVARRKESRVAVVIRETSDTEREAKLPRQLEEIRNRGHEVNDGLALARLHSRVRTQLPRVVDRFPINRIRFLRNAVLNAYELLFREQRVTNNALVDAVEKTHQLSQALCGYLEMAYSGLAERLGGLDANLGELGSRLGEVESLKADVGGLEERLGGLDANLGELGSRLGEVESRKAESSSFLEQTGRLDETQRLLSRLKRDVVLQERRINLLLAEGRRRLPKRRKPTFPETLAEEDRHRLDALYVSFEDEYRGTRDDIRERQRFYLPIVRKAGAGTSEHPIVDVGCGRGEWLEVLKEEKLVGRGVDLNRVVVEQCRQLGLEVENEDLFAYLRRQPDASLGAVTGFHIIEHLPFESALNLLDESLRVLKVGGVAIFETPNPDNVLVGSRNFYLDPTHRNPLPSSLLRFLAEQRGLVNVEVFNLHPAPEAFDADDGNRRLVEQLNAYFSGPQDYAIVGYKP